MGVHQTARDSLRPRGVRLLDSTWAELEAVRLRRGEQFIQDTIRAAVAEFIENERARDRKEAA